MKKIFLISILFAALCYACKKSDDIITFKSSNNIFFNITPFDDNDTSDSIVYSFAYKPGIAQDTVWMHMQISGLIQPAARTFKIVLADKLTTAKPGLDFEALKESYTMPADSGTIAIPIILYSKDTLLNNHQLQIGLALQATSDFGVSYQELDTARILLSNQLQKPSWWDVWAGSGLGDYSRVRFELFIRITGQSSLPNTQADYNQTPLDLYYLSQLNQFLTNPAKWIQTHPEDGYVLQQQSNGDYYFYNTATPNNKYLYQKNAADGKYYFMDENGQRIAPQN